MPSCFMLFEHWDRRAASRADCTAGNRSAIRTAMMAITTSNSMRVNPIREDDLCRLGHHLIMDAPSLVGDTFTVRRKLARQMSAVATQWPGPGLADHIAGKNE